MMSSTTHRESSTREGGHEMVQQSNSDEEVDLEGQRSGQRRSTPSEDRSSEAPGAPLMRSAEVAANSSMGGASNSSVIALVDSASEEEGDSSDDLSESEQASNSRASKPYSGVHFEQEAPLPQYDSLNQEFAVPVSTKDSWAAELEGGGCEVLCGSGYDDYNDDMGCTQLTACVCGLCLKADRVGNMPVLWAKSSRSHEAPKSRPNVSLPRVRQKGKPTQLLCVLGPFWPCMLGVTYPLIFGVSLFTAVYFLPQVPAWVGAIWAVCTATLVVALALTACSNPGLVRRHREEPPPNSSGWRWNDQVQSYRPPRATFDRDCGVVIEEFDHTCPWTGTGIGQNNMGYFSTFVGCLCVCLIMDVVLIVGMFEPHTPPHH